MNLSDLSNRFAAARLPMQIEPTPLDRGRGGLVQVVQMDIGRGRTPREELFRMFPGAPSNRLIVTTYDKSERQLVLFVHEPRRRFEATVSRSAPIEVGTRVLFEDRHRRVIESVTPERKRHFLCGMDESHLFIAQLPHAAPTIKDAHRALAPAIPPQYGAQRADRVRRQGEWFLLPITPLETNELDAVAPSEVRVRVGVAQAANLRRAGRPHVADEVIVIADSTVELGVRIYARGAIRHPDHRTVELRAWHRVIPNRERFEQPVGVLWVD
jgi:hypothetical protein